MMGTGLAQALPLIAAPILSRLFSPAEFGTFALFTTICNIVGVVATGRYELAIVLPEDERVSASLVALASALSVAVSCLALLAAIFAGEWISQALHDPTIRPWLYWVPVAVVTTAAYQAINYWFNRRQQYRRLALNRVTRALLQTVSSVGLGLQKVLSGGLILGQVIGQGLATIGFATTAFREDREIFRSVTRASVREAAKRYADFPRFAVAADGLNSVSQGLPTLMLAAFGQATVGHYGLVLRVLGGPLGIVAGSFADVFKQRASRDYNQTGSCREIWWKTFWTLMAVSIPLGAILVAFGPAIFAFVLGERWRVSGEFARALAPMLVVQFAASPLSRTLFVAEKQRWDLVWQVGLFFALFLALKGGVASMDSLRAVQIYGYAYAAMYVVYLALSYRFTVNPDFRPSDLKSE